MPLTTQTTTWTLTPNGAGDHGTHVAGIAAANAGVVADVVGVAPQAQILAMKVFSSSGSNGATWADILAAADDAVALGADVINMSLGSTCGFSTPEGEEGVAEVLENIASSRRDALHLRRQRVQRRSGHPHRQGPRPDRRTRTMAPSPAPPATASHCPSPAWRKPTALTPAI